jgi:DNA-directed RNA polymerase subunit RPC12/RpoP
MRAPDDPYPDTLHEIIKACIAGDEVAASKALAGIRFEPRLRRPERLPSRTVIARIYARDNYHCRYCGERVILTPVMRLVARLYPEQFPYHLNWKADSTHRPSCHDQQRSTTSCQSLTRVIRLTRPI